MKNNVKIMLSVMLVLALVMGCFATMPLSANAAEDAVYRLENTVSSTGSFNTVGFSDGTSENNVYSALIQLVNTADPADVLYALCVNQKVSTAVGVTYNLVDMEDYLEPELQEQVRAVLNYVSINYGLDTAKGVALAQAVIWRIIHSDITSIIPQNNVGITQADIDEVYNHHFDLVAAYDVDVTMSGAGNRVSEDANYVYYGPFSVSYNYVLADIDFTLTVTAGVNAIFTDDNYDVITQVKPGVDFYVGVPTGTTEITFSFDATASKAVNTITGIKFLISTNKDGQELVVYQPLVQPLVNPTGELYTYSCSGSFAVTAPMARFSVAKTVDGVAFDAWFNGYAVEEQALILDGISFQLYADRNGMVDRSVDVAFGKVNSLTGLIDFVATRDVIDEGWYWVIEDLQGTAQAVFESVDPIKIYIGPSGIAGSDNFDYGTLYTIVNGYNSDYIRNLQYGQNSELLNDDGDIFTIKVTNSQTGVSYPSFCAHANSKRFAGDNDLDCVGYMKASTPLVNYDAFLSAFNYIEDKCGNVDENRVLTQTVIWVLLGGITFDSDAWRAINLSIDEKAAVQEVIDNSNGYIGEGKIVDIVYLTCEKGHDFEFCQPQFVPLYGKPIFDNKVKQYVSEISIAKTVNALAFDVWAESYDGDIDELLADISFELYEVNTVGTIVGSVIQTSQLSVDGQIVFNSVQPSRYAIVEVLSGKAAKIFEETTPLYIYVDADGEFIGGINFDYDTLYKINYTLDGMVHLNYPGINNDGEIFYIGVTNTQTGVEYVSFCANENSKRFAGDNALDCEGYVVAAPLANYDAFLSAFNYIEDHYGAVGENRVITQVVTWVLLGAIDITSEDFDATSLTVEQKTAVYDIITNYQGYTGNNDVVDIVYLTCEKGHDFEFCQPQLVPLYGKSTFDNRVKVVPVIQTVSVGFIGYHYSPGMGETMWGTDIFTTSFYWQTVESGAAIDWDAVYEAYANDPYVKEVITEDMVAYWQSNPGGVAFTGARPDVVVDGTFIWMQPYLKPSIKELVPEVTVNFLGVEGVTVQYYTNVAGWQTVGIYDETCTFVIPEEYKATWGITTVRVIKNGMSYSFAVDAVNVDVVLDVPVVTIAVFGVATDCNLAIVQNDWVYNYTPATVGVLNYFNVFDNGKGYFVRLSKTGFYPVELKAINAPTFPGQMPVEYKYQAYFGPTYIYQITVPDGVTNVRMQSNNWIYPMPANADDKLTLIRDYGNERDAQMSFEYHGKTCNVDFKLDGTNPFDGLFVDETSAVTLVSATPSAFVIKLNGNKNDLTITVTELYSDGTTNVVTEKFSINNNAAGTYSVGNYTVYVDTKGNDQIRACYIV